MRDLWGFVKLTDAEFHFLAKRLRKIAQAEQVLLAEVDGKPVGFSVTLPDINEAIRPLNGRLTKWGMPLGLWRLSRGMRKISTARMVILDVLQGYRRRGVAEARNFANSRVWKKCVALHGRGIKLDFGRQCNDQPHYRSRRRPTL